MALKRAQNDIEELRTDGNSKSCQIDLLNTEAEKQRHAHHTDCDRMSIRIQHLENYEKRNTTELSRLKDYALALEKDLNTTESRNKFLETKTSKLAKDNKSMGMRLQSQRKTDLTLDQQEKDQQQISQPIKRPACLSNTATFSPSKSQEDFHSLIHAHNCTGSDHRIVHHKNKYNVKRGLSPETKRRQQVDQYMKRNKSFI